MIKIPKSWDEVLLDQFIEIKKIQNSDIIDKTIEILAILTDTLPDDEIWEDMDIDQLIQYTNAIKWISKEPESIFSEELNGFKVIDVYKISLGEFIDLDYYFSEDYINNLPAILGIFYRKTKNDEWDNIIYEPYGLYDIKKRGDLFLETPLNRCYGVIKKFFELKDYISTNYRDHFEPVITEEPDEEIKNDPDYIEEERKEAVYKKWAWENLLYKFSNGDITKYDSITSLPLIFVLNHLSFTKEMDL